MSLGKVLACVILLQAVTVGMLVWSRVESRQEDATYAEDSASFRRDTDTWHQEIAKEKAQHKDLQEFLEAWKKQQVAGTHPNPAP